MDRYSVGFELNAGIPDSLTFSSITAALDAFTRLRDDAACLWADVFDLETGERIAEHGE